MSTFRPRTIGAWSLSPPLVLVAGVLEPDDDDDDEEDDNDDDGMMVIVGGVSDT